MSSTREQSWTDTGTSLFSWRLTRTSQCRRNVSTSHVVRLRGSPYCHQERMLMLMLILMLMLLWAEIVYRSCSCCYHRGSLYPEGRRNISLEDGRTASCCGGELLLPLPSPGSPGSSPSSPPPPPSSSPEPKTCWSSCFQRTNSYHNSLLEIISRLREEQAAKKVAGTCFVLDSSLSADTPARVYNYQRNVAMLLALTLPVNSTNPMFLVKYQNYKSCSKYHPELSCKVDRCEAAKTIGTSQNMKLYEAVKPGSPYLGNNLGIRHFFSTPRCCILIWETMSS